MPKIASLVPALALTALLFVLPAVQAVAEPAAPIASYIQEPMPDWYAEGFTRGHLNIPVMMQDGYTRLEAVEVQNQMKDLLEAQPAYMQLERQGKSADLFRRRDPLVLQALAQAIRSVKDKHYFESGFHPVPLQQKDFYVAFDGDETLLQQWYASGAKGPAYADLPQVMPDTILHPALVGPGYVSMTPGWEKALLEISRLPGCKGVLLFSAKEDASTQDIVNQLKIGGQPLRAFLKGVFTRNYLVRDSHSVKLSKDLRIIDESLQHVILVDDNATRIFPEQYPNLREFPKYSADAYLNAKNGHGDPRIVSYFDKLLPTVVNELKESDTFSQQHKTTVVDAFYPYSMDGQTEVMMLEKQGYAPAQAIDMLRTARPAFNAPFFVPKQ